MKYKYNLFLTGLIVSFSIYLFFYQLTFNKHPILLDDNLISVIEKHPNYVLDIKNHKKIYPPLSFAGDYKKHNGLIYEKATPYLNLIIGNEHIPILFESRQGGMIQYIFRKLFYPLGTLTSLTLLRFLTSFFSLLLFGLILQVHFDQETAIVGMFFLSLDAVFLNCFSYALSEYGLHLLMLSSFYFFSLSQKCSVLKKQHLCSFLGALCLGAGLYLKITVLWYVPIFVFCFYPQFFGRSARWIWPVWMIQGLIYLKLMNFALFKSELQNSYHPYLAHNPLRELYNLISNKISFLSYMIDPDFIFKGRDWHNYFSINLLSLLALVLFWGPFFLKKKKKYLPFYFFLFSYFFCMWISLPKSLKYMEYLFPLVIPLNGIFALYSLDLKNLFQNKFTKKLAFTFSLAPFLFLQIFLTTQWIRTYQEKGPVSFLDYKLQKQVAIDLEKDNQLHPYTVNIMDAGRMEYLTHNKILPNHLWHYLWKKHFETISDLLLDLEQGSMILTMDWNHRWMMPTWGEVDLEKLRQEAREKGIEIFAEKIYQTRGIDRIFRFSFSKIQMPTLSLKKH